MPMRIFIDETNEGSEDKNLLVCIKCGADLKKGKMIGFSLVCPVCRCPQ